MRGFAPKPSKDEVFFTIPELCQRWKKHRTNVLIGLKKLGIKPVRPGGRPLYPVAEVLAAEEVTRDQLPPLYGRPAKLHAERLKREALPKSCSGRSKSTEERG
jgi:hypothetical protein